jgi:hypothetical protein
LLARHAATQHTGHGGPRRRLGARQRRGLDAQTLGGEHLAHERVVERDERVAGVEKDGVDVLAAQREHAP